MLFLLLYECVFSALCPPPVCGEDSDVLALAAESSDDPYKVFYFERVP